MGYTVYGSLRECVDGCSGFWGIYKRCWVWKGEVIGWRWFGDRKGGKNRGGLC
jgi:hypothetical protein